MNNFICNLCLVLVLIVCIVYAVEAAYNQTNYRNSTNCIGFNRKNCTLYFNNTINTLNVSLKILMEMKLKLFSL